MGGCIRCSSWEQGCAPRCSVLHYTVYSFLTSDDKTNITSFFQNRVKGMLCLGILPLLIGFVIYRPLRGLLAFTTSIRILIVINMLLTILFYSYVRILEYKFIPESIRGEVFIACTISTISVIHSVCILLNPDKRGQIFIQFQPH